VRRYREGIAPLVEAGRLAAILFQFPHSFHYTPDSRRHLSRLCEAFQELPKAVEFRGAEWQRPSVYEGLRRWNAAFVNVDTPRLPRLPEPGEEATADLGYVRLHGRNRANWWQGDNASRYDYLYSPRSWRSGCRALPACWPRCASPWSSSTTTPGARPCATPWSWPRCWAHPGPIRACRVRSSGRSVRQ